MGLKPDASNTKCIWERYYEIVCYVVVFIALGFSFLFGVLCLLYAFKGPTKYYSNHDYDHRHGHDDKKDGHEKSHEDGHGHSDTKKQHLLGHYEHESDHDQTTDILIGHMERENDEHTDENKNILLNESAELDLTNFKPASKKLGPKAELDLTNFENNQKSSDEDF